MFSMTYPYLRKKKKRPRLPAGRPQPFTSKNFDFKANRIKDFTKYPELVFINKHDVLIPVLFFIFCYFLVHFWNGVFGITEGSTWALSGWQVVAYGFCLGTVLLYHSTFL